MRKKNDLESMWKAPNLKGANWGLEIVVQEHDDDNDEDELAKSTVDLKNANLF